MISHDRYISLEKPIICIHIYGITYKYLLKYIKHISIIEYSFLSILFSINIFMYKRIIN